MSSDLVNQIKAHAHAISSRIGSGRWGLVTSARSTDTGYEVRVQLQPEAVTTGWLPVVSMMVGNGWGIVSPPALNTQAFVVPQEGRADHGVVIGMTFNVQDVPPQPVVNGTKTPVKEGQFALVHKNGSYLYFDDNDVWVFSNLDLNVTATRNASVIAKGALKLSAPTVTIDADGNGGSATVQIDGNLNVSGDITWGTPATSATTHRHGEGSPVAAGTVPPTPGS